MEQGLFHHAVRLALISVLSLCLHPGPPRQAYATLTGTITDASGAVVPGAHVEAINQATGAVRTTTTGPNGQYFLASLPPGRYTVSVSKAGFQVLRERDVDVLVGEAQQLNLTFALGAHKSSHKHAKKRQAKKRQERITGRSFLVGWKDESPGYGLYSYLLLRNKPLNPTMRARELAVIRAYLRALSDIHAFEGHVHKAQLNITYIFVTKKPAKAEPDADWVLNHYFFTRAQTFLRKIPGAKDDGPFIISTRMPLSNAGELPAYRLFQDMSDVPPSLAGMWEQQFEKQADNPDFWKRDLRVQAVLHLRTLIGNAAQGLPGVKQSAAEIATFLGARIKWH